MLPEKVTPKTQIIQEDTIAGASVSAQVIWWLHNHHMTCSIAASLCKIGYQQILEMRRLFKI